MKSLTKSKYSYLFVSYIPQDLSYHFGGKNKFRVSLKSVIFSESKKTVTISYDYDGKNL